MQIIVKKRNTFQMNGKESEVKTERKRTKSIVKYRLMFTA